MKASPDESSRPDEVNSPPAERGESLTSQLRQWMRDQLPWWSMSFTVHIAALASLLLLGRFALPSAPKDDIASFVAPPADPHVDEISSMQLPNDPNPAQPNSIELENPAAIVAADDLDRTSPSTVPQGDPKANPEPLSGAQQLSIAPDGFSSIGPGPGRQPPSNSMWPGGRSHDPNRPYDQRHIGLLDAHGGYHPIDATSDTDRAVAAAVYWLARHQSRDGSWSLQDYVKLCRDKTCTGPGAQESISAATAMGVLPFLGAGITHNSKSKLQPTVARAIYWLVNHERPDGDLSAGATQQMYSHALATIALCEDYGMTHDKAIGAAAQKALNFIVAAQNSKTGGWRYHPGEEGDTSVTGWQLMALKSGQIAKLDVNPAAFDGVKRWLAAVAKSAPGESSGGSGQFSYQPEGAATPTMSAVGLLCSQYLNAGRGDPVIVGGVKYLMANMPVRDSQNIYYWYYAAQAMHNMNDRDWDRWNQKMRDIVVATLVREGCAAGSWDPDKPVRDAWGPAGGRLMMTSLSALTLEVYYRYLPLYQFGKPAASLDATPQ
jgi:hypothetical protein